MNANKVSKETEVSVQETKLPYVETTDNIHAHQHIESRPPPSALVRFMDQWWLYEIFGWLLSAAGLAGLVALVGAYDSKPSPTWTLHVGSGKYQKTTSLTINTFISLLATVMKSGLLIPVGASLSQLKWMWFSDGHPLADFQMFDAANRGPLGSIVLLWGLRGRRLACLGAVIIVASLALDFSFQALIAYPLRPVKVGIASLSIGSAYFASGSPTGIDASMISAIYSGIFDYRNPASMKAECSTGNCTWTSYTTLGVCGQCFDVTENLQLSCGNTTFATVDSNGASVTVNQVYCNQTLPNGLVIPGIPNTDLNNTELVLSGKLDQSIHFANVIRPISVLSVIQGIWPQQDPDPSYPELSLNYLINNQTKATECGWYYCVHKYKATSRNGILVDDLTDVFSSNPTYDKEYASWVLHPDENFTKDTYPLLSEYTTEEFAMNRTRDFVTSQWEGTYYHSQSTDYGNGSAAATLFHDMELNNITAVADNLALSMTNNIRNRRGINKDGDPVEALGTTYQDQPHIAVRWRWLALPVILEFLALVLLMGTMISAKRERAVLWKGSSLAAFSHPLTREGRQQISEISSPREMEKLAQQMPVKYEMTEKGHRLVQPHG